MRLATVPTWRLQSSEIPPQTPIMDMLLKAGNSDFVRSQLRAQGIPLCVIDAVLKETKAVA
jgi:hypothetical protein